MTAAVEYNSGGQANHCGENAEHSTWATLRLLGTLVPIIMLNAAVPSLIGPNGPYNGLNFFAETHTTLSHKDIHCELTPEAPYCQAALPEKVRVDQFMGLLTPFMHVITWPALGALSDAYGRRPIILLCMVLSFLPLLACALFVFFDVSMYLYFVLAPFRDLPVGIVYYSYIIDKTCGSERSAAFGMMNALDMISSTVGLLIGTLLTLNQAFAIATSMLAVTVFLAFAFLSESLPSEKRNPLRGGGLRNLFPWKGLSILCRNDVIAGFTLVSLSFAGFDGAFQRVGPYYVIKYVEGGFTAADNSISWLTAKCSSLIWLGFCLGHLTRQFGETCVLFSATWSAVIYGVLFALCHKKWQIFLLNLIFCGPMSMIMPSVATIKSKLVGEHEQGVMQGSITTVQLVANSICASIFAGLFLLYNQSNRWTPLSGAVLLLSCVILVPALVMIPRLERRMKTCAIATTSSAELKVV